MDHPSEEFSSQGHHSSQGSGSTVEAAAVHLVAAVKEQFRLSSEMAAIDLETTAAMNDSTRAFYAALHERLSTLLASTQKAQKHANAARPLADDIDALLQRVRRLEALVDRLDEYTAKQETALTKRSL